MTYKIVPFSGLESFSSIKVFLKRAISIIVFCFLIFSPLRAGVLPEVVIQQGHSTSPFAVQFSPDGKYFASGGEGIIHLWDISTGLTVRTFTGLIGTIYGIAFDKSGRHIVGCSEHSKIAILWDVKTGEIIQAFTGHEKPITSIAFSPDGNLLLTGSYDYTAILWNTKTGQQLFKYDVSPNKVAFSKDGKYYAVMGSDLTVWGTKDYTKLWSRKTVYSRDFLEFCPNGNLLSIDDDGILLLNDSTGEVKKMLGNRFNEKFRYYSYSLNKEGTLLSRSNEYDIKIYSLPDLKETDFVILAKQNKTAYSRSAFSPDGSYILIGGQYKTSGGILYGGLGYIELWDIKSKKLIYQTEGKSQPINSVTSDLDGKNLVVGTRESSARIWNLETGTVSTLNSGTHSAFASYSPDGKKLACAMNTIVQLYDGKTFKLINKFRDLKQYGDGSRNDWVKTLTWINNNEAIGTTTSSLKYYNMDSCKLLQIIDFGGLSPSFGTASVSADGTKTILEGALIELKKGEWTKTDRIRLSVFYGDAVISHNGAQGFALRQPNTWSTVTSEPVVIFPKIEGASAAIYSDDDKLLAIATSTGKVTVIDLTTQTPRFEKSIHQGCISAVSFNRKGTLLYTTSDDGTTRITSALTGELIATMLASGDNESVIVTPYGYYFASKSALKCVAFRIDNKAFPFEQFDLKLNRPDIVLSRLGFASKEVIAAYSMAYQKRLKKMGITEAMLGTDFNVPTLTIKDKALPVTTDDKNLAFSVMAKDVKYNLDRINIFINDVPLYGQKGISLKAKVAKQATQNISIQLNPGKNKVQVSVINAAGVESLKETFITTLNNVAEKPSLYALFIGVSNYKDESRNLTYAAKDANDLATVFKASSKFKEVHVQCLTDTAATRNAIIAFKKQLMQSNINDVALIFYAGHGLLDSKLDYYLSTPTTVFTNPAIGSIAYSEIEGLLEGIPARKKLLLIDACNSGEIDKEDIGSIEMAETKVEGAKTKSRGFIKISSATLGLSNSFEVMQELYTDLRKGTGATIIAASGGKEFSVESDTWQNGAFTYAIKEGLNKLAADADNDKSIKVSELRNYVSNRVIQLTNGGQHPTMRAQNFEEDYDLY